MQSFVIIGHNSGNITVFGTPKAGRPFNSEASAERFKARLEEVLWGVQFIVVPITGDDLSGFLKAGEVGNP